jgi:hypothetical protein
MPAPPVVLASPRKDPCPPWRKVPWRATYTPRVAERICEEVASGRSLERIGLEEPWAPSASKASQWMRDHPEFKEAYQVARALRAEKFAEDIIDVAYSPMLDPEDKRIIIAAHQWLASKMCPKDWGDRKIVDNNISAILKTTSVLDVSHLTMDELHAAERALDKVIEGVSYSEDEGDEEADNG